MSTPQTSCILGTRNLTLLVPITQQPSPCNSNPTTLQNSPGISQHGEIYKFPVLENPAVETILSSKVPNPRTLTLTAEEFYQWRQVLGQFKQSLQKELKSNN